MKTHRNTLPRPLTVPQDTIHTLTAAQRPWAERSAAQSPTNLSAHPPDPGTSDHVSKASVINHQHVTHHTSSGRCCGTCSNSTSSFLCSSQSCTLQPDVSMGHGSTLAVRMGCSMGSLTKKQKNSKNRMLIKFNLQDAQIIQSMGIYSELKP